MGWDKTGLKLHYGDMEEHQLDGEEKAGGGRREQALGDLSVTKAAQTSPTGSSPGRIPEEAPFLRAPLYSCLENPMDGGPW